MCEPAGRVLGRDGGHGLARGPVERPAGAPPAFLTRPFTFENASSTGFGSGEYGGRNTGLAPPASTGP